MQPSSKLTHPPPPPPPETVLLCDTIHFNMAWKDIVLSAHACM